MTQSIGYDVDVAALRRYTGELSGYTAQTRSLGDQIGQVADTMSDESWGIVGLFTKEKFNERVGQLREFVQSAEEYLNGLNERVGYAAGQYEEFESLTRTTLEKLNKDLQSSESRSRVDGAPSGYGGGYGGGGYGSPGGLGRAESVEQFKQGPGRETEAGKSASGDWMGQASGFITDCMSGLGGAIDNPLKMLVGMGLDFLFQVCTPLQDAVEYVSGDADSLQQGSGQFTSISQGVQQMNSSFVDSSGQSLSGWTGSASVAAKKKLADYSDKMEEVASRSDSLSELLEASAYVMEVIEELIKSILTEFITWLIMLWLPALAASVISFGSSIAAATTATTVKTTQTVATTTQKVVQLTDLLNALKNVLIKLALKLVKDGIKKLSEGGQGAGAQGTGPMGAADQQAQQDARQRAEDEARRQADERRREAEAQARRREEEARQRAEERRRQMEAEAARRRQEAQQRAEEQRTRMQEEAARRQQEAQQRARDVQEQIRDRFDDFSPSGTSASGFSPSDLAGAGSGGGAGGGLGGVSASGAGLGGAADGAGSAAGKASGAATPGSGAGIAGGVAGGAAGAAAGGGARGAGGGMMGGGGAGGQKGGEDKEHKRKYAVEEKPTELFEDEDATIVPPVIEDR